MKYASVFQHVRVDSLCTFISGTAFNDSFYGSALRFTANLLFWIVKSYDNSLVHSSNCVY